MNEQHLIQRYLSGNASPEETNAFRKHFMEMPEDEQIRLFNIFEQLRQGRLDFGEVNEEQFADMQERINAWENENSPVPHRSVFQLSWIKYAAAAMIILSVGIYLLTKNKSATESLRAQNITQSSHQGAILTLANGSTVSLDTIQNGTVAMQNGSVAKVVNGTLLYEGEGKGKETVYNTMSTPKGRQYHLVLPDGSQAWLNAASSITFPAAFIEEKRVVTITGEAYFDIAKSKKPFIVNADKRATVEVLGTQFNINCYSNTPGLQATLISGAVRVSAKNENVQIKPGQQATITTNIQVRNLPEPNKILAWKNGVFDFEGVRLADAMHEIERWYDLQVVYENNIPDITFGGSMPRDLPLNDLLDILKKSGVKFRLGQQHKLIVSQ